MKKWKYYVLWLAYILLGRLSPRILYGIAHVVGDGAYLTRTPARRAVMANMRRVMGPDVPEGEVRRTAREAFRNATRYYADLISLPRLDVEEFSRERLELEGVEYLEEARASGRGAVMVGAHFGNPEMAVQGLSAVGIHLYALSEPLSPPALSEFTHWLRSHHGHEYRTVSFSAIKEAMRRLKRGGIVALLLDRDVGGTGVPMEFFGAEAKIPVGAVDLALRTGADLIPAWAWRIEGYRFRAYICPPLEVVRTGDFDEDVRENTRRLLAIFEGYLSRDPGQWAVLEPIWPDSESKTAATPKAM